MSDLLLVSQLVWDYKTGDVFHSNDGGLYKRTLPRTSQGDWYACYSICFVFVFVFICILNFIFRLALFRYYMLLAWMVRFSMNGDLAIGEFISASVDPSTNILLSGAQDNGCAFSDLSPSTSNGGWNGSPANLQGNGGVQIGGDGNYINMDLSTGSGPRYFATAQEFQAFVMVSPKVRVPRRLLIESVLGAVVDVVIDVVYLMCGAHVCLCAHVRLCLCVTVSMYACVNDGPVFQQTDAVTFLRIPSAWRGNIAPMYPKQIINHVDSLRVMTCLSKPVLACFYWTMPPGGYASQTYNLIPTPIWYNVPGVKFGDAFDYGGVRNGVRWTHLFFGSCFHFAD
jgi:hypothetical protein